MEILKLTPTFIILVVVFFLLLFLYLVIKILLVYKRDGEASLEIPKFLKLSFKINGGDKNEIPKNKD